MQVVRLQRYRPLAVGIAQPHLAYRLLRHHVAADDGAVAAVDLDPGPGVRHIEGVVQLRVWLQRLTGADLRARNRQAGLPPIFAAMGRLVVTASNPGGGSTCR